MVLLSVPGVNKLCHSSHNKLPKVSYRGHTIYSEEVLQQGDPLELLFRGTINPSLQSLVYELELVFMDDVTLSGSESQVARDVKKIRRKGTDISLQLNDSKCEFICRSAILTITLFADFKHLSVKDAELLGAPLTFGTTRNNVLSRRCQGCHRAEINCRT